jgi:hypothetical protein
MAVLGLGGFGVGFATATGMLVFRRSIEPFMPIALPELTDLMARHSSGGWAYRLEYYSWIVGWLYFVSVLWLVLTTYSLYQKRKTDRRVDDHLRRNMQMDIFRVEPLPRALARDAENEPD